MVMKTISLCWKSASLTCQFTRTTILATSVTDKLCKKAKLLVSETHIHNLNLKLVFEDWVRNELIPKHKREGIIQETPSQ